MEKPINGQRSCLSRNIAQENFRLQGKFHPLNIPLKGYEKAIKNSNKALELCIKNLLQIKLYSNVNTKTKERLLEILGFEANNYINAVKDLGNLIIREGKLTSKRKNQVDALLKHSENMLRVIEKIIELSKIKAEIIKVNFTDCNIHDILEEVKYAVLPEAIEKGINFQIIKDINLPIFVRSDPICLKQCLVDIIKNAIKFTKQKCICLNIHRKNKSNIPHVQFEIRTKYITCKHINTELMVVVNNQIATLLGGEIMLAKGKNDNFTLSLFLPINIDNRKKEDYYMDDYKQIEQNVFTGHILLAEDEENSQRYTKSLLDNAGLEVTIVTDGNQVLQKAISRKYDLILMDTQMPHMDGYEATKALRSQGIKIPIIALVTNAINERKNKWEEVGCNGCLIKPINPSNMLKILNKYLLLKVQS